MKIRFMTLDRFWTQWYSGTWPLCQSGIMKRRCEDPLISQTLGFDTYRMGNCIKTDNESKYKIEELTKGNFFRTFNVVKISFWLRKKSLFIIFWRFCYFWKCLTAIQMLVVVALCYTWKVWSWWHLTVTITIVSGWSNDSAIFTRVY